VYTGAFLNADRHGRGEMVWCKGEFSKYTGDWEGDRQNGRGEMVYRNGRRALSRAGHHACVGSLGACPPPPPGPTTTARTMPSAHGACCRFEPPPCHCAPPPHPYACPRTGNNYTGDWWDNEYHGVGTLVDATNGDRYEGKVGEAPTL
jgi:hypothetical protein